MNWKWGGRDGSCRGGSLQERSLSEGSSSSGSSGGRAGERKSESCLAGSRAAPKPVREQLAVHSTVTSILCAFVDPLASFLEN